MCIFDIFSNNRHVKQQEGSSELSSQVLASLFLAVLLGKENLVKRIGLICRNPWTLMRKARYEQLLYVLKLEVICNCVPSFSELNPH